MNILNIVLISVLPVFILWTVWILFVFIKGFFKYGSLYKSSIRSVFASKLSLFITLLFYTITFGLSGGMSSFISNIKTTVETNFVDQKAGNLFLENHKITYSELTDKAWEDMNIEPGNSREDFIDGVNNLYGDNWWENTGKPYFLDVDTLAMYLLFENYSNEENISYVFEQQMNWKPSLSSEKPNESFYFLGLNSWDPFKGDFNDFENIYDNSFNKSFNNKFKVNEYIIYDGSLEDVYTYDPDSNQVNVAIQKEYFDNNDLKIGDTIKKDGIVMNVKASFRSPNWTYSIHDMTNPVVNSDEQSLILINNKDLLSRFDKEWKFIINYGYNSDYSKFKTSNSFVSGGPAISKYENNIEKDKAYFEEYSKDLDIKNAVSFNLSAVGQIESLSSARASFLILAVNSNQMFLIVLLAIFLTLIAILMVLLIKRRVKESSKQLGTLKALGYHKTQVAATFIIFPLLITLIGGSIAIGFSTVIAPIFSITLTNFLSAQLGTALVPIQTLAIVFLFPFLFSMIIGYLSAKRIIRKETLDLLSNRFKNEPNRLIRGLGYLAPEKLNFKTSYVFKGFLRATGKSMLLGVSIFGSILLSSISFSSSTMVDNVIGGTAKLINFEGYTEQHPTNLTQYYNGDHKDSQEAITLGLVEDTGKDYLEGNKELHRKVIVASLIGWENGYDILVDEISKSSDLSELLITPDNDVNYLVNNYLPLELMLQVESYKQLFLNAVDGPTLEEINEYEIYDGASFGDYSELMTQSLVSSVINISKDHENIDVNDLIYKWLNPLDPYDFEDLMTELSPYKTDIVFQDVYFDEEVLIHHQITDFIGYDSTGEEEYKRNFTVLKDSSDIERAFNFKGATDLLENYEGDSIPLYVANTFYSWLENLYDVEGNKIELVDNKFVIETELFIDGDIVLHEVEYEIVGSYDSTFSFGSFTSSKYLDLINDDVTLLLNKAWIMKTDAPFTSNTLALDDSFINDVIQNGESKTLIDVTSEEIEPLSGYMIDSNTIYSQALMVYEAMDITLLLIAMFSLVIGMILVIIAISEIIESAKREVSMLKAFGYSTFSSSFLILLPYLIIIGVVFIISIPSTLVFLGALGTLLTSLTGTTFIFTLTTTQWFTISSIILGLITILIFMSYISFRITNPLDAIRETDE